MVAEVPQKRHSNQRMSSAWAAAREPRVPSWAASWAGVSRQQSTLPKKGGAPIQAPPLVDLAGLVFVNQLESQESAVHIASLRSWQVPPLAPARAQSAPYA